MKRPILIAVSLLTILATQVFAQITGERPIASPAYAPLTPVSAAAIASDGNQFLAAWIDSRDDHPAVYVARIDRDGTILDTVGTFVAYAESGPVGVAWNGDSYVVVWQASSTVMAARIASGGTVVDPAHLILSSAQIDSLSPIAANANVLVVAYGGGYSVLDHQLHVIDSAAFAGTPSVWVTGDNEFTLIPAGSVANSRSVRLDSSGSFVSLNLQAAPAGGAGGVISCHGQSCVWVFDHLATHHLAAAPFDPIAQTSGTSVDLPLAEDSYAVAATASGYVVVTSANISQRLDLQGNPIGASASLCCRLDSVAAASNGRDAAILRRAGTLSVAMMTATSDDAPRTVAVATTAQHGPALAGNGFNYLAVWTESSGIYARRLGHDGVGLDLDKQSRRTLTQPRSLLPSVSVLFDGTSYIAAVSSNFDRGYSITSSTTITTLRIDPSTGSTLAINTICGNDMRITNNGSATAATWVDCAGNIAVAFLDINGALASTPVLIASSNFSRATGPFVAKPSLAWNGSGWLLMWEEQSVDTINAQLVPVGVAIRGTRLTNAFTAIDTDPILTIATGPNPLTPSRLASDGRDFLAVWSNGTSIHTRRITAAGALLADQQAANGFVQDLVWDGTSYALAFLSADHRDLAMLRMRATGQPIDTQVFSPPPDEKRSAGLLAIGGGRVIATYTRVAHELLYGGVERAFIAFPRPARGRAARSVTP